MSAIASQNRRHDCLLSRLFRRRSKKASKLRVTGLCEGKSPGTCEFPVQTASNAENVSIWWRHHWFPCRRHYVTGISIFVMFTHHKIDYGTLSLINWIGWQTSARKWHNNWKTSRRSFSTANIFNFVLLLITLPWRYKSVVVSQIIGNSSLFFQQHLHADNKGTTMLCIIVPFYRESTGWILLVKAQ